MLNVGTAHLGEFGSREAIARTKSELPQAVPQSGVVILNADDPAVAAMAEVTAARVVRVSRGSTGDVWAGRCRWMSWPGRSSPCTRVLPRPKSG
ncbi:mur ligase middle domain protein [Mycobacterium kansasii]|uniref:Mur ligase middle domain protein n=1 Tax=Mycobacterium kansasii TaxID=1768 RepID=A0A1V3WLY2_MYCKA|nr:mur ligase middle domain protein [Mycobacterium kansasii]